MKKFTTIALSLKDDTKVVGGFAAGGTINPGDVAELIFGKEMNGGHLFAYLFRRFGHPNHGSDPYKNLCSYCLTTPMPGLFLCVTPYLGKSEKTSLHFAVRFNKAVRDALNHWEGGRWRRHCKILERWVKKNLVLWRPDPSDKEAREPLYEFKDGLQVVRRKKGDDAMKLTPKQFDYASFIFNDIYNKFHPEPRQQKLRAKRAEIFNRPWNKRPRDFGYKIHRALHVAMLDLKTPTHVRDLYFNAVDTGDHLIGDDVETAKYYEHAGYAGQPILK